MTETKHEDFIRASVEIDRELHLKLRSKLVLRGITFSEWVRSAAAREVEEKTPRT